MPTNSFAEQALILSVPRERAIGFRTKIEFVKSGHEQQHKRPNQANF